LTAQELQSVLEKERLADPDEQRLLEAFQGESEAGGEAGVDGTSTAAQDGDTVYPDGSYPEGSAASTATENETPAATDPFDEIDFGEFFNDYLDPGFRTQGSERPDPDSPTFEAFLSAPMQLSGHLQQQLSVEVLSDDLRRAAEAVIGNLDENGYFRTTVEDLAASEQISLELAEEGLRVVQVLDPAGVAARDLRECLLLQLADRAEEDSLAWRMVEDHLELLDGRHLKELCRRVEAKADDVEAALALVRSLDPMPGSRFSGPGAQLIEPEVFIFKDGDQWVIQLSDDGIPQLRLNRGYRHLLERGEGNDREVRNYVKERYQSALQLIKNIEQRKQTILRVCQCVVDRQQEFLESGPDYLKPMMIKEIAEEIGVHPSTVSRAVSNKYCHTPQGTYELRYFFTEAVQGFAGNTTSLVAVKRLVKRIIDEEDPTKPLTDEQIMERLREEGIDVTRRTVAKYRDDLKIPSTHHRRVRK
jgi:RNA polymerase sigma-54 factor